MNFYKEYRFSDTCPDYPDRCGSTDICSDCAFIREGKPEEIKKVFTLSLTDKEAVKFIDCLTGLYFENKFRYSDTGVEYFLEPNELILNINTQLKEQMEKC